MYKASRRPMAETPNSWHRNAIASLAHPPCCPLFLLTVNKAECGSGENAEPHKGYQLSLRAPPIWWPHQQAHHKHLSLIFRAGRFLYPASLCTLFNRHHTIIHVYWPNTWQRAWKIHSDWAPGDAYCALQVFSSLIWPVIGKGHGTTTTCYVPLRNCHHVCLLKNSRLDHKDEPGGDEPYFNQMWLIMRVQYKCLPRQIGWLGRKESPPLCRSLHWPGLCAPYRPPSRSGATAAERRDLGSYYNPPHSALQWINTQITHSYFSKHFFYVPQAVIKK